MREAPDRELVSADVVGADHDGPIPERFDDLHVRVDLLVLGRHRGATQHEELGPHESDALGSAGRCGRGLIRQVHVRQQRHAHTVRHHRVETGERGEFELGGLLTLGALRELRQHRRRRARDEHAVGAIEDHAIPALEPRCRVDQPDHGGKAERARENCDM